MHRRLLCSLLFLWACSDANGEPCASDADCKGDRVCGDAGTCEDPGSAGPGAGGAGNLAGSAEGGATAGPGGAAQGGQAEGGAGGSGGAGGAGGTPLVDTCPIPSAAFAVAIPPSPGNYTTRRRGGMQLRNGEPNVLAVDYYSNSSFYSESLKRFTLVSGTWQTNYVADEQWGSNVATAFATTSGADPCVVYTDDYDGNIRLVCDSISDRIIAPGWANALGIAADGPLKHVVRVNDGTDLEWLTTDGGTPTVPALIDQAGWISAISFALDSQGTPHVAYHVETGGSPGAISLEVRHATLGPSGWDVTVVASETAPSSENSKQSVALAIDPWDQPAIAYHRKSTRSLELVEWQGSGFGAPMVLDTPQPNYPNDDLGRYVAMQSDCYARKRLVYSRVVSTDPSPNSQLFHAIATANGLEDRVMVPLGGSFSGFDFDLGYVVDADGHDHIGVNASWNIQYASR